MTNETGENSGWQAIADLGSNTFQLLIARKRNEKMEIGLRKKIGVGLGKKGLSTGTITPEALEKATHALIEFGEDLNRFSISPKDCQTIGTSTFRNARNRKEILVELEQKTGFKIQVIDGQREAELVFSGVKASGALTENQAHLIIDIGGGSVEFIKCEGFIPVWKQSFEIGGLRLMEKFHQSDPISDEDQKKLTEFVSHQLSPLWKQIKADEKIILVGCSGSFDTLIDMQNWETNQPETESIPVHTLKPSDFQNLAKRLIQSKLEDRLKMGGMIPLRAEMMVVAVLLIQLIVNKLKIEEIRVSTFSLKEGLFNELAKNL